jgi:type IV pilus assembly protein PilF
MRRRRGAVILLAAALLLSACAGADKREKAEKDARRLDIYTTLAADALAQNNLNVAVEEANKALAVDANSAKANDIMALVQARMRDDVKAEKYFRRALAADPGYSESHNNLGVFLCERGRIDEAIAQFDAAVKNPLYRTPGRANLNAGQCLLKKGDYTGAERYFRAALALDAKSPIALYNLSRLSYDRQDYLSARAFLTRYFELGKDSPDVLLLAVKTEHALGAKDAEASYKLRLRSKFPDSREARQLARIR